jgi:hypothetical protein
MRAAKLVKIAAEAEILRIQHMLKRQGMRVAFGLMAAVFAVSVLVLVNITGWQVLRLYVQPIYVTLVLLGVNLVLAGIFGALAARSSPGYAEREALKVRRQALQEARGSLALTALVPLAGTLVRASRGRQSRNRRWPFGRARSR